MKICLESSGNGTKILASGCGSASFCYLFGGSLQDSLVKGLESIKMAMVIGTGIGVAYSVPPKAFGWKKEGEI